MVDSLSRRQLLATCTAVSSGALAGCSLDNPRVRGGRLFLENTLPEDYRTSLVVTEGRDGEGSTVVDGRYRVPANHALQYQGVVEPGTAYTVAVEIVSAPEADRVTVTIPPCEGNGDVSRDVSVRLREDGTGVIPWQCDEDAYTRLELEYVPAERYAIGTGTDPGTGATNTGTP